MLLPYGFRLALLIGCLAGPLLLAGPPNQTAPSSTECGPDDYCPKSCIPIGSYFRPFGCDGYDKKCLAVHPPVCLSGLNPYCKKTIPCMGPRYLPPNGPVDGCCPPNWFGLKRRP